MKNYDDDRGHKRAIATRAVRFAKLLHSWGCEIIKFYQANTGSCYLIVSIRGVRFNVRVSDHSRNSGAKRRNGIPEYLIRVDKRRAGTQRTFSTWLTEVVRSHYSIDATPSSLPDH